MSLDINSVADACAALDYLHRRGLLCDACGSKVVEFTNFNHAKCGDCIRQSHGTTTPAKVPNALERCIVQALQRWLSSNFFGG